MEYVAFVYFPTPNDLELDRISEAVYDLELRISHLGKNDPPKKWSGSKSDFLDVLRERTGSINYTHSRAKENGVEIDFTLQSSPKVERSSISISGKDRLYIEDICVRFSEYLDSYLSISGQLGLGSEQKWKILVETDQCPANLREKINS